MIDNDEKETKQMGIRFPLTLIKDIKDIADLEQRTFANMVRVLCQEALIQRKSNSES